MEYGVVCGSRRGNHPLWPPQLSLRSMSTSAPPTTTWFTDLYGHAGLLRVPSKACPDPDNHVALSQNIRPATESTAHLRRHRLMQYGGNDDSR